jgi:hypothetical protein
MISRAVKLAAGTLAIGGTLLVLAVLFVASKPDKKALPRLPVVNVKQLLQGQMIHLDTESLRYFVVRPEAGEIHVVAVPIDQGTVLMPEVHWWKPFMNCKDFGLDTVAQTITAQTRFRCRDEAQPDVWAKQWQWDIFGKHIGDNGGEKIDDMYRVRFERSGDELIFKSLESN